MKIKATLTLTSAELMEILKEKYPDFQIDWIWFDLKETREHWEDVNHKKFRDLQSPPELKQETIRIWSDGSFDLPEK